jgi:uncharacterized membrane protein
METSAPSAPAARRRASAKVTLGLGLLLVVAVVLFSFQSTWYGHWYALFRSVHIVLAVVWVGGGVLLTILGLRAERSTDPTEMATLARQAAFAGERLFAPAGGLVLLAGIAMMLNTNSGWGKFWIDAGLLGYAITMVTGMAVLSPLARKIDALLAEQGPSAPETQAAIQRILFVARIDVTVLLLVVLDMVTKPFS